MGKEGRRSLNDQSEETWNETILTHPVLGPELINMQLLYSLIAKGKARSMDERLWFGELYQQVYGPSRYGSEMLHRRAKQEASRLKSAEAELVRYFVGSYETKLKGESRVSSMFNPIDLCKTALAMNGSDEISRRRRLEAKTRFIAARLLLHIDHVDSEIDIGRQAERLVSTLIDLLFVKDKSLDLLMLLVQDPQNAHRISQIHWNVDGRPLPHQAEGMIVKPDDIPCRFMQRPDGTHTPIILDDRVKDDTSRMLKMIRKGQPLKDLQDKCGYTLVVLDDNDEGIVFSRLEKCCQQSPFKILEIKVGSLRDENPDSAKEYKTHRLIVQYNDQESGMEIVAEINVQRAKTFFDATYSRAPENHDYYRFRQLCGGYFLFRFPQFAYGIDWRDGSVQRKALETRLGLLQA